MQAHTFRPLLLATVLCLPASGLPAQLAPQPTPLATTGTLTTTGTGAAAPTVNSKLETVNSGSSAAASANGEDVVQMSVFEVNSSRDTGYQSLNTASGSRLNTALKDTAASISPFSQEFLSDVGATTIDDMLSYGVNVETDTGDGGDTSGDNTAGRSAGSQDNRFRIRGMAMDVSVDNVLTGNPVDTYNIDRAEVSSGPNSILFGMGGAGGIVALTTKRANVNRNTLRIQNVLGTWSSPAVSGFPYYRATMDYNLVLMPHLMAFRLNALYQEGGGNSWRYWMGTHNRRVNPTLTIKPFKTTNVTLNFETGSLKNGISDPWNASDGVTGWLAAGQRAGLPANTGPILDSFSPAVLPPAFDPIGVTVGNLYSQISPVVKQGANAHYTLFDNNGALYDMRQTYYSNYLFPGSNTNYRLPADMSSYYYSTMGPGAFRNQIFNRYQAVIEQSVGLFNFQFTYDHSKNDSVAYSTQGQDSQLQGDPNSLISTYNWTGNSGVVTDPYSGQLYMEDRWMQRTLNVTTDSYRLTSERTINLGQTWGRHRLVLNLEHVETDRLNANRSETLLDQNNMAISTPSTPANAQNYLYRRQYVTPGDFTTYYPGNWQSPLPEIYMNGNLYHSAWVNNNTSFNHTKRTTNTIGLSLQSYMLNDTLVFTLGARNDFYTTKRATKSQITNPLDPRVTSGQKAWHEWDFNGGWGPSKTVNPYTYTAGAVWHATDRLSAFANFSTNRGAPSDDVLTVLPDGNAPPLSEGRSLDYGVMFDVLANGKIFIRLTKFDTQMRHIFASGNSTNNDYADSAQLGSTNMHNIFDALYYLDVTNQGNDTTFPSFSIPGGGTVQPGPGAGPMPASQFVIPSYNGGLYDSRSRGYEFELTANFTKNWTGRVGFSWTQQERTNIFNEIFDYYAANIPNWLALAQTPNPNSADGQYWVRVPASNGTIYMPLYDYVMQQLYVIGGGLAVAGGNNGANGTSVRQGVANRLLNLAGAMGARPIKFTVSTRYTFNSVAWLKGFAIGGSVIYRSPNYMPDPNRVFNQLAYLPTDGSQGLAIDRSLFTDMSTMIRGNSWLTWNGFLTYKRKFFGGRTTGTFQLNVDNIFCQDVVMSTRVNQYGALTRVSVTTPRAFRLTATFDF